MTTASETAQSLQQQPTTYADQRPTRDPGESDADRILSQLHDLPIARNYPELLSRCSPIIRLFMDTLSSEHPDIWRKLKRKMAKELNEMAFILNELIVALPPPPPSLAAAAVDDCDERPPVTVIDLCSGIGFLSMFLSHLLPPECCSRIVPVDVLFPCHIDPSTSASADTDKSPDEQSQPRPHPGKRPHLPTEHLLDPVHPIPIRYRRANIKKGRELRQIVTHCIDKSPGPVIILGVHLCKALSVHAVRLFHGSSNAAMLYLKPCCLPGRSMMRTRTPVFWEFGEMDGGGFGVADLYGEESKTARPAKSADDGSKEETKVPGACRETNNGEGDASVGQAEDEHVGRNRNNPLFTRWVGLLHSAAACKCGIDAEIRIQKVQARHFQNQFITARRDTLHPC